MNLLDQYSYENTLSKERILELVDEYTLYCFYLDFEPELRRAYSSPLHKDEKPSFSVFESNNSLYDYLWKDNAKNVSGGIFKLIMLLYGYNTYEEVYTRIAEDFELDIKSNIVVGSTKIINKERPLPKPITRIRIKSKPFSKEGLEFWKQFYITEDLLNWKQVKEVEYVWYNDEQAYPFKCKELTFAYPEYNTKYKSWHYQIYSPYSIDYKFRNDLIGNQLYGNNHLEFKTNELIITKSNKDILVLKLLGYESVAARSETTPIKQKHLDWYATKYSKLIVLFDNDVPGIQAASLYNLPSIIIPVDSGCKDISDYIKQAGIYATKELLINILGT